MRSPDYSILGLWHVVLSVTHLFTLRIHCRIFNKVHVSLGQSLEQFEKRRRPRLYLSSHRWSPNEGRAIHLSLCFMLLFYFDVGVLCRLLDEEWSLNTVFAIWTDILSRRGLYANPIYDDQIWRLLSSLLLIDYPTWYTLIFLIILYRLYIFLIQGSFICEQRSRIPLCSQRVSVW